MKRQSIVFNFTSIQYASINFTRIHITSIKLISNQITSIEINEFCKFRVKNVASKIGSRNFDT